MRRSLLLALFIGWSISSFAADIFVGGAGASDSNPGTAAQPFATIQKAASVANNGDVVKIRAGIYRETITPANSGVTFQSDNGAIVTISGLSDAGNSGWTVHSGNIYKKTITLPVAGQFNEFSSDNTTLLANQVFKDGEMMILARWPNITTASQMLEKTSFRGASNAASWGDASITDNSFPVGAPNLVGGYIWMNGWFVSQTRQITGHSGNTLNYPGVISVNGSKFRKFYFITNKLGLLDVAKEWHYESNTLYFFQPGGGSPTGVEYKVRNWGFDLRNKSNITVIGLRFIGCDPVITSESSSNVVVDNIRAKYINHTFIEMAQGSEGSSLSSQQCGIKLIGPNCTIKNSEIEFAAASGIWLGQGGRAENNYAANMGYNGQYTSPFRPWKEFDNQVITKNTATRLGRSAVELGANTHRNNTGMDISYNDFSMFNMLSVDGGVIYSAQQSDHTGMRIHHNWFHDNGLSRAEGVDGVQVTGPYFDQGSGPADIDHNVIWIGATGAGDTDFYAEINNDYDNNGSGRDASEFGNGFRFINNTLEGTTDRTYISYAVPTNQTFMRNNIFNASLESPNKPLNVANCVLSNVNPLYVGGNLLADKGLYYRLQAGSPARNTGMTIPGITDGSVGVPDMGAYEHGGTDWVAGYKAVPLVQNNASPVVGITAPTNNASFAAGTAITISANASDSDGSVTRVEFFDGTTKIGEDLTTPYSFTWNNATAGTHTLTARATDNSNGTGSSAAITITVTGNAAPTVAITAPANNTNFTTGSPITITATAADANGSVTKVEFFSGTTKLGEDLTSPYSFAWNNAVAGTHALTARATDNANAVATSAAISVIVTNPAAANASPIVAIVAPSNNAQFASGSTVTITASATDANGTITKVEFFNGTTKLGEDATNPYSFAWTNATVGTHAITAKATDNLNLTGTSSVVNVIISPGAVPTNNVPIVSITSPASTDEFFVGDNITISAAAADNDGSVMVVEFFSGATKLGEDLAAPYTLAWNSVQEGSYSLTAVATDNLTGVGTSMPVNITVAAFTLPGEEGTGDIYAGIPRFFSPNDDGSGDLWVWGDNAALANSSVRVFNRAGQQVYENSSYNNTWDGKSDGQALQDGDYYYVIRLTDSSEMRGSVRIIR